MKLTAAQWLQVAERYAAGEPSTVLGKEFGVHYLTVLHNVRRLGGSVRTYATREGPVMTEAVKARVDELANTGMSGAAIARELGVNPTLIRRYRAFPRVKKDKHIKLGEKDKSALTELLQTLCKFRATERGAAQAKTIDPQIKALRGVLS